MWYTPDECVLFFPTSAEYKVLPQKSGIFYDKNLVIFCPTKVKWW
jgi:hypothetical protein